MQLALCPSMSFQCEEVPEDRQQQGRQESHHDLQTCRRCEAAPERLERAHVHDLGDVRGAHHDWHVEDKEREDQGVADEEAREPCPRVLRQVPPPHVRRARRCVDDPLLDVPRDAVQPDGHLRLLAVVKGHEARGKRGAATGPLSHGLLQPFLLCQDLLLQLFRALLVEVDAVHGRPQLPEGPAAKQWPSVPGAAVLRPEELGLPKAGLRLAKRPDLRLQEAGVLHNICPLDVVCSADKVLEKLE
mmetsp:Transcript_82918/g.238314  ORF Transcript_82918/g.238314 Transcript_82918/m.238314 type:complete len:245 (-) Transcript_82918:1005-1739(-)